MKALLSTTLLCLMLGTPALTAPAPPTTTQNQYSLTGTWSSKSVGSSVIFIFDNNGAINFLSEKTYGDYKYYEYEFPDADDHNNRLMNRISSASSAIEPPLK